MKESESDFRQTGTFKLLLMIIIIWGVLAIIFGLTDLEISIASRIDIHQGWGDFGADYGEVPGYGFITIGVILLIGGTATNIKKQKIFALFLAIIGLGIMIYGIISESSSITRVGGGIGISALLFTLIFFNRDWKQYHTIAVVIILFALLFPLLFVQLTKLFCGRVRFRNLSEGFIEYTPWFAPPGLESGLRGNASFPSGHTAMGWMFLPLLFIVKDRKSTDPVKIITYIGVIGWGLFVGASRVVVGAHYASDVLFAAGMGWVLAILLYYIYYYRPSSR